jgi:hypothetical protein
MSFIEQRGTEKRGTDRAAQLNALHLYGMATAWPTHGTSGSRTDHPRSMGTPFNPKRGSTA